MGNRLITILDKTLDAIVSIICVLLLLIGVYSLLDNLWLYQNAQDKSLLIYRPGQEELLTEEKKISENQVAWLTIDDTNVDYPIMQGVDNYEFLNKDPYGEFSLSGSIFLDAANDPAFTDVYSLVYGHHMAHGAMFGALDDFRNRAFFNAHRTGRIVTKDSIFELRLFAVAPGEGDDPRVFAPSDKTAKEITAFLQENATIYYKGYRPGDRIVALTTCWGETNLSRLLVFGVIREKK